MKRTKQTNGIELTVSMLRAALSLCTQVAGGLLSNGCSSRYPRVRNWLDFAMLLGVVRLDHLVAMAYNFDGGVLSR